MLKDDVYGRKHLWALFDDDETAHEEVYFAPNRIFILRRIFPPNVRPYYANAKRIELHEEWASFEDPNYLVCGHDNRQVGRDKVARIASFNDIHEAKFLLRILVAVLNAPADSILCREISPFLMKAFANFPTELETVDAQEEKEAKELEERRKVSQAQMQIEQYKKEAKRNFLATLLGGDFVYVFELEFGVTKIGHSTNVSRRISEVQSGGLNVIKASCIKATTTTQALQLEKQCHKHFADKKKSGQREYFFVPYEEACNYLRSLVNDDIIIIRE